MGIRESQQLSFEAIAEIGHGMSIASAMDFNALFEVCNQTGECRYVTMFSAEEVNNVRLHSCAVYLNGKVYFIPASAGNIAIYEIESKSLRYVSIEEPDKGSICGYNKKYKFTDVLENEKNLYMIPSTYPGMVVFDSITENITIIHIDLKGAFFRKGLCRCNDMVLIPSTNNDVVLEFCYTTLQTKIHYLGNMNKGCWSMCRVGNDFYLAPKNPGALLCWQYENNIVRELLPYPSDFLGNGFLFSKIYHMQGKVYAIPVYANMFICYDIQHDTVERCDLVDMEKVYEIAFMEEIDDKYLLRIKYIDGTYRFKLLDTSDNSIDEADFLFTKGFKKWEKEFAKTKRIFSENRIFDLQNFVDSVGSLYPDS